MKEMVRGERAWGGDGGCGRGAVRSQALVLVQGWTATSGTSRKLEHPNGKITSMRI